MAHWLTTHFPHPPGHPWFVYLKARYRSRADRFSVGDEVFFYELAGKTKRGRRAIIVIGEVTEHVRANRDHRTAGPDEADDVFEWEIPCGNHDFAGSVSKDDLYGELEWPQNRPTQMSGGVISLDASVAKRLRARFKSRNPSARSDEPAAHGVPNEAEEWE